MLTLLPESPRWLASRGAAAHPVTPLRELFQPALVRFTILGVLLSAIPMVGAWSASKWMIPWADKVAGSADAGYKAATQGWWALGAVLGSFARRAARELARPPAQLLPHQPRHRGASPARCSSSPPRCAASFHPVVFAQGFVATLFFGWLALYLPELFPTRVRATGSGLAYNSGRFATAAGVLLAGVLFTSLGGDYPRVGTICASIYALGFVVIWWAPNTATGELED